MTPPSSLYVSGLTSKYASIKNLKPIARSLFFLCCAVLNCIELLYAVLCCAVVCYSVLCCTVLYCILLCCAVLCYSILFVAFYMTVWVSNGLRFFLNTALIFGKFCIRVVNVYSEDDPRNLLKIWIYQRFLVLNNMHRKITAIWLVESLSINPKQCNYKSK